MNVLFLTHSFPRRLGDAAGSFILRLAVALRSEGMHVRVVAPAAADAPEHAELLGIPVARFHYAPSRYETLAYTGTMASQVRESWSARLALLGFLGREFSAGVAARREHAPALVHAHWWFPSGLVGSWVAALGEIPLVTTLHGSDVRLGRDIAMARPLFRHVLHRSARVTAVSRWLARESAAVAPDVDPVVAPMPVDTDRFLPGTGDRSTDRLLFVGRLNEQKGLHHLLPALRELPPAVTLDVVGDGERGEALRSEAGGLGVADRIRWHGTLDQARLAPMYRSAAAVVVPSLDEGLGLVAVEALLAEAPVIASDSGGLRDVVQHERTGILVAPGDSAALARAIREVLARPDRGGSLGAAGRLHALSTFAPESVARRYAGIYRAAREHANA